MLYAKQTDNSFHITVLKVLFPETSFPTDGPDLEWLALSGVWPVDELSFFDDNKFKRISTKPTLIDGVVYTAKLVALTDEDKADREAEKASLAASRAREQRNQLLKSCDWTQLADSLGFDKDTWATYRQELRDITKQVGFPSAIIWPSVPGTKVTQLPTGNISI